MASKVYRVGTVMAMAFSVTCTLSCGSRSTGNSSTMPAKKETTQAGTMVSILLDRNASFVPFSADDLVSLRTLVSAIGDKATKEWAGTTEVVIRGIGTTSVIGGPICNPVVHETKLIGSGSEPEAFTSALGKCVEAAQHVITDTPHGDRFTDISGAVAAASQATESSGDRRFMVLMSDFLEQQAPSVASSRFHLHGETVLLMHRPGIDDKTLAGHLANVRTWRVALMENGASRVMAIPEPWVTRSLLQNALDGEISGTFTIVLLQQHCLARDVPKDQSEDLLVKVAEAVGTQGATWSPPVSILWFLASSAAAKAPWMPPIDFQPRLVAQTGEINTGEALQTALHETAVGSLSLATRLPVGLEAPLGEVLGFLTPKDVISTASLNLIIVSDFLDSAQAALPVDLNLGGAAVALIYTPHPSDRADPNRLFDRLARWKSAMTEHGAQKVCTFEFSSFVPNQMQSCLLQERPK